MPWVIIYHLIKKQKVVLGLTKACFSFTKACLVPLFWYAKNAFCNARLFYFDILSQTGTMNGLFGINEFNFFFSIQFLIIIILGHFLLLYLLNLVIIKIIKIIIELFTILIIILIYSLLSPSIKSNPYKILTKIIYQIRNYIYIILGYFLSITYLYILIFFKRVFYILIL